MRSPLGAEDAGADDAGALAGWLWASATEPVEASADAITIRQSGCIIPRTFSDVSG
jgi:hypothetical protein